MLDEPTNLLDISTKDFVTQYLKNYKGMVLMISHDVDFLNQIVNTIMFIDKMTHKISVYNGDYIVYLKRHAQELELKEGLIFQQEPKIKVLANFVQKAKQAGQTKHNLKRIKCGHNILLSMRIGFCTSLKEEMLPIVAKNFFDNNKEHALQFGKSILHESIANYISEFSVEKFYNNVINYKVTNLLNEHIKKFLK